MRNILIATSTALCLFLSSCMFSNKRVNGNGNVTSEDRRVSRATRIKLSGSMDVYLTQGPTAVRVEAEENLLKYIVTEVDDNWLRIKTRDGVNISSHAPIKVYITTPTINAVSIAGSGNIVSNTKLNSDKPIIIKVSGSGDVNLQLNTPKVDANIAGSGNIIVSGETKDVGVDIAGAGDFKGGELKAENADVKIAGSGDVEVFADVRLEAKIVGSGNIAYRGNARVEKKIIGSGDIRRKP